jgi:hypothetical protein
MHEYVGDLGGGVEMNKAAAVLIDAGPYKAALEGYSASLSGTALMRDAELVTGLSDWGGAAGMKTHSAMTFPHFAMRSKRLGKCRRTGVTAPTAACSRC